MRNRSKSFIGLVAAGVIILSAAVFTSAQTNLIPSRITQAIDPAVLTILRGNTHPLAQPQFDRGPAPASLPMQRMLLVLQRSMAQETALDTLLEEQQDASSANYHRWLTPQQFGQQFGPSDQDIQTVTLWLQSQGFQIDRVSNGRTVIEFSGTAGAVQSAFHTAIHQYAVNGENHWANSSDPEIPSALTPVVVGIDTLHNFPRTPMIRIGGVVTRSKTTGNLVPNQPLFTLGGQCGVPGLACYGLSPYDFGTIYDVTPLWNASPAIDGTGQTIAIVGESDINIQDVRNFRNYFGLPANDPQIIVDGADPGTVSGDETESDLDVEWAGAVAKGATIDFVSSASTESSLGVDLSAEYVVDNNLAGVLSESYGTCELGLGTTGNQFYNQLWQQAAAQGITVLVATGDNGSAGCDDFRGTPPAPAQYGLMVSGFASTPYDVSVGGTDFNDLTDVSTYWSSTNTPPPGQPSLPGSVSARSYIPETTWNNSCTNAVFGNLLGFSANAETNCNNPQLANFVVPEGGSGGKSSCTSSDGQTPTTCGGGYSKPSWQTALTPNDGNRDLPDVSLFAAVGSPSGAFYLVCAADVTTPYTSCQTSDPNTQFVAIGGTSAAAPTFAGMIAMVEQKTGSRQGNANYILYKLAAQSGASCNSSNGSGANCVFHDVTSGTNAMPCATGSPNCVTQTPGHAYGVLSGYTTSAGYDQATGLGSVDASNLIKAWSSFALDLSPSSTTLTLTPPSGGNLSNLTHGQTVTFSTAVTAVAPATGTPTGTVSLVANTGTDGESVQSIALDSNGDGSGSTNALPGGTYSVVAQYPGDGTFKSSVSPGTTVTVNPEASRVQLAYELLDPNTGSVTNPDATTAVFGTPALLRVNVTSAADDACANNSRGSTGCPTGNVVLSDNSSSLGTFALNSQGYAEDQLIDLAGGTHLLGATYPGDNSFSAPNPNPTTQTATITPASTSLAITATPLSVTTGGVVYLNASVLSPNIYSDIAPTGTITFYSGTTVVATAAGGDLGVNPTAHEAFWSTEASTTTIPHGQNHITATYSGDSNYASSVSTWVPVSVLYPSATSVTTSNSSISYGSLVTFTASVSSSQTGAPPITGVITFIIDGAVLSYVPLSNGSAQYTTSAVPGGEQTIQAAYSGDNNFASGNGYVQETVVPNSTTTGLTTSSSTITAGQSVTVTAMITPSMSGPIGPTGPVQFLVNGAVFMSEFAANGQAQLMTTTLPVGTDQISAKYLGDSNYTGSTSSSITLTVNPAPTFTVTANSTAINVPAPGQSGSATLTFTGENGFTTNGNATVSVGCDGLPAYSSCSISPSSVNIATNGSATATLTVTTTAPSAVMPGARSRRVIGGGQAPSWNTTAAVAILLLLSGGIAFGSRGRQRPRGLALALLALVLVFANAGCGGGSSGGGTGAGGDLTNSGTPAGSANFTVSVTINGVTQTLRLTVDVQ